MFWCQLYFEDRHFDKHQDGVSQQCHVILQELLQAVFSSNVSRVASHKKWFRISALSSSDKKRFNFSIVISDKL